MFYDFAVPLPANTAKTSPVEVEAKLTHGVVHRLEIEFPAGCAGLAHLAIDRGLHQVWPTNPPGSFASDNHVIAFDEAHEFTTEPYTLSLRGWNLDDTYPHTLVVRIGIRSLPPPVPRKEELTMRQKLARIIPRG